MKQLIQNVKTGETLLMDVPTPQVQPGQVLIQTGRSLVSLGTERMLVEFGKASLLNKVRQQPDRVKQVVEKIQSDGLRTTIGAVIRKLNQPVPLGYCNVGTVLAVGDGVTDLCVGDRVASNGYHAEVVCVPRNLVALIPDAVSDDEAAFTVIGAISLNSIRLLAPSAGETVVVIGLGLLGLMTAELLRISGCQVIGIEIVEAKGQLATARGITVINPARGVEPINAVMSMTTGLGADGVIITASSRIDKLLSQAVRMSRRKGTVVLVGVTDLTMSRADLYEKEVVLRVARSYGPGRYDEAYEQRGQDYPVDYVRWTANRNFQAILQFMATGQLQVMSWITEVVPLTDYQKIYSDLQLSGRIASLLTYPEQAALTPVLRLLEQAYEPRSGTIGIIGAGNFTGAILVSALKAAGAEIKTIASAGGLSATVLARKFGITQSTTDYQQILNDPDIDLCVITTRHDSHARLTSEALKAGKHVFVEKPLAIYPHELPALIEHQQQAGRILMVGFNRRFSPYAQKMKTLLGGERSADLPMNIVVTVNAGSILAASWVHDRDVGGGRILGEACHFVDLITFLTGSRVMSVCLNAMGRQPTETSDSASILLRYENGSTATINYFSNGSKAYAKERVEVYWQERTLVLDNFRTLTGYGFKGFSKLSGRQDKGHVEQMKRLINQVRTGQEQTNRQIKPEKSLIPFDELINTTQTLFAALQSLRERRFVAVAGMGITSQKLNGADRPA
ncbi:bi-domain-containing oxidoreductase [Spirosoma radiotolerans]|uniref:bi-domain-containing oxidoreductase n=1 Tax=Spirosoma radiotolerans TaxID=1379870 RepID=UPI0006272E08|nr:bi-domain-containing oxidoreductase [Spirosoma radiotolerans]